MIRYIARGLLGRLLGYGVFGAGLWLLFQGFWQPHIPLAILGGVMIPAGMFLMVLARQSGRGPAYPAGDKEDDPGDSVSGSGESDKLPP